MIRIDEMEYSKINYPAGEIDVRLKPLRYLMDKPVLVGKTNITWIFENINEIFEISLICDAIRRKDVYIDKLFIPYIPFGRQDRETPFKSFPLKVFCDLINSLNIPLITTADPHSDVTPALLNNCKVMTQDEILPHYIPKTPHYLVSPDGGALKKIHKIVNEHTAGLIECSKLRNIHTGEITETKVHWPEDYNGQQCVIVDDICDRGRTFIEIAKKLKEKKPEKIILLVTHGIFSKGIEVFDGLIDEIFTMKGKIK